MKVMVTSARFPHALAEIRWFGSRGHEVYAADTFKSAPGAHSRFVTERIMTAAPALDPRAFVSDVEGVLKSRGIDLLVPGCEEVFYLARHAKRLACHAELFFPSFEVLARLHDKRAFADLAKGLGLLVPETRVARDEAELRAAIREFPEYIARGAFSRGGTGLLSNVGAFRGKLRVEDCIPTPERPWIVQEYLHGTCVCSFSVARRGRLTAHCTYEHPRTILNAGGVSFVSVDEPEAVEASRRIIEALDYHGQISFDFMRTEKGLYLLECNPRPTAGVALMPAEKFVEAAVGKVASEPYVLPAGAHAQYAIALVREMLSDWREIPANLEALTSSGNDVFFHPGDAMPGLFALLSYEQVMAFRRHARRTDRRTDLVRAQFFDIEWDGGEFATLPSIVPPEPAPRAGRRA